MTFNPTPRDQWEREVKEAEQIEQEAEQEENEAYEHQLMDLIKQFVKTNDLDAVWGHSDEGYVTVQFGTTREGG